MTSSNSTAERVARLLENIRAGHLTQLEQISASEKRSSTSNWPWKLPSYYQYMEKWSLKAKDYIRAAVNASMSLFKVSIRTLLIVINRSYERVSLPHTSDLARRVKCSLAKTWTGTSDCTPSWKARQSTCGTLYKIIASRFQFTVCSSDWPTLFLASRAAREGRSQDALKLLADSDAEIRKLVSKLIMREEMSNVFIYCFAGSNVAPRSSLYHNMR